MMNEDYGNVVFIGNALDRGNIIVVISVHSGFSAAAFGVSDLLQGVNDDELVLADLMNGLVAAGVIPYYLFQCRPVVGVKNQFQVPLSRAVALVDNAKAHMSGQAKGFRYAMSHPTGKIEILGNTNHGILFKYHQAKHDDNHARYVVKDLPDDACWLDDHVITSNMKV